ncbi:hypothetical protein [Streptomyces fradiae]|uniref:hypothetical protein n=1 Tax=Streptomyces fradiae TaxID=1906 RepID=UPI0036F8C661
MSSSAGSAHERLTDVVAAVLEVAAEVGGTGAYTDETARVLTAVIGKIGARISADAEMHGFAGGWQEAVAHLGRSHPDPDDARVLPIRPDGDDEP